MPYDLQLDKYIRYFEPQVLAPYRELAERYSVKTDLFDGHVTVANDFYESLTEEARAQEYITVRFGYRALKNGDLKLAVFALDLVKKSPGHVEKWRPFLVQDADWLDYDEDERFFTWVQRFIEGKRWGGLSCAQQLREEIALVNGLTSEAVGVALYDLEEPEVVFPAAQNTKSYEDAHRDMYGLLVDSLSKACLTVLAQRLGRTVNADSKYTLRTLAALLPSLQDSVFTHAMAVVSEQRRRASHKVRPPAKPFKAYQVFSKDLDDCLTALRLVKAALELELSMDAEKSKDRHESRKWLPTIDRPPEPNYSIVRAVAMKDKTVAHVEVGFRQKIAGVHESEAIIIHFTDGSIMSIDTGCSATNIDFDPDELHVDFMVHWVPPKD